MSYEPTVDSVFFTSSPLTFSGVNIGGAGSYVYDTPANNNPSPTSVDSSSKTEEKRVFAPKAASKGKWEMWACIHTVCTLNCGSICKHWLYFDVLKKLLVCWLNDKNIDTVFGDLWRIFSDVFDRACLLGNPCQQEQSHFIWCFLSIYLCCAVSS